MSLIFGMFGKDRELRDSDWRPCVEELAHEGRRSLETLITPRLVLAAVESRRELDAPRIAEDPRDGRLLLLGGEVFDYESMLAECERDTGRAGDPKNQAALTQWGLGRFGIDFLRRLTGAFAVASYDPAADRLTLANDPFGMHPLFVWENDRVCLFGSEIEPITRFSGFEPRLDLQAVSEYYCVEQPLDGRTFFVGLRNLRPGSFLEIGRERRSTQYEELAVAVDRSLTLDAAADRTFELLRAAATARLRYRKTAHAALTGGLDTRLLIGLLTPEERVRVEFRTIRETWMPEDEDTDFQIVSELARHFDLNLEIRESEGPGRAGVVDRSFLDRLRTLKGKAYKFEGFFGDNFLSPKVEHSLIQGPLRETPLEEGRQRLESFLDGRLAAHLPNPIESVRRIHGQLAAEQSDYLFYVHRLTRAWFTHLGGGSPKGWVSPLRHVAHGLDSLFRDTALLRHLLSVPVEYHRERRLYERLYERCLPDLCTIPTTRASSVVPHAPPVHSLGKSRADYRPILAEYTASAETWDKGIYDRSRLTAAVADPSHRLVPPFADFESWYRDRFLSLS